MLEATSPRHADVTRHGSPIRIGFALCFVAVLFAGAAHEASARPATSSERTRALDSYGKLAIGFIKNQGQAPSDIAFYLQSPGKSLYFSNRGHALRLVNGPGAEARTHTVRVELVGAESAPMRGARQTEGLVSYFRGSQDEWHTGIPVYQEIHYVQPWPGVALSYQSEGGSLESIYTVAPFADPGKIRLKYSGHTTLRLDAAGNLVYDTPVGSVQESAPIAFQDIDGRRVPIASAFQLLDDGMVSFEIADYDRRHPLIIDPTLTYSGFIGGVGDDAGFDVDIDNEGNAYVIGYTASTETTFPVIGGPDITHNGGTDDAFVAKVNAEGSALIYLGYIGGLGTDIGRGIAVDSAGNAYVTGYGNSGHLNGFPLLVGPDLTYNGGTYDSWVAKVNPTGTALLYAGYIGGSGTDLGFAIDIDPSGNAYVTGNTDSQATSFPVLVGPDLTPNGGQDGFVAKVTADGSTLAYAGYIGGTGIDRGNGIAVDSAGSAYVTGPTSSTAASFPDVVGPDLTHNGVDDAYVAKISVDGSSLIFAGYIGGTGNDRGNAIAVDANGNAYVTGVTASTEATFPVLEGPDLTHNGGDDAFVAKVATDGTALVYSGYIGGSSTDSGNAIAVNSAGSAYVAGSTFSTQSTFPVLIGPDLTHNGATDIFIAKVNVLGTALEYAGYLGGNGGDPGMGVAADNDGNAYVTGTAASTGGSFPAVVGPDLTSNGAIDAFVARVTEPSDTFFKNGFE